MTKQYTLVGVDGNAFAIMGYVRNAMRKEGYTSEELSKYSNDAMKGDYNRLIVISMEMLDKVNKKARSKK